MSTFISFDKCGIQVDSTPNSKALQFLNFILSTSQHTKFQNQSPERDSCQLQMKNTAQCVFLCITHRVTRNHQNFTTDHNYLICFTVVSSFTFEKWAQHHLSGASYF